MDLLGKGDFPLPVQGEPGGGHDGGGGGEVSNVTGHTELCEKVSGRTEKILQKEGP